MHPSHPNYRMMNQMQQQQLQQLHHAKLQQIGHKTTLTTVCEKHPPMIVVFQEEGVKICEKCYYDLEKVAST
jgi:hypothetical protein